MELKNRMTVEEMSEHLVEHTGKIANRVTVGRYARKLGYKVYKPMIEGRIRHFYLKDPMAPAPAGEKEGTGNPGNVQS
jgi:hypothetical protein